MSFEIKNVLWTPIEKEIGDINLRPMLSTLSDRKLEALTLMETGLTDSGFASVDLTSTKDFANGRLVNVSCLQPLLLGEAMPSDEDNVRWFEAGGHVIWLALQFGSSCYSDRRIQAAAQIFGPVS
jgi:hypothetical protein